MEHKIKGTHVPRIALAALALAIFFGTFWAELTHQPIDFTHPAWGGVMVLFLFLGVAMLAVSWMMGLDTRSELWITLVMIGIHLTFDTFILVWVFAFDRVLPVALVQVVVQAYWVAGLLDVLLMFWSSNMERTASGYVPPEERIKALEVQLATSQSTIDNLRDTNENLKGSLEKKQRSIENAHRKHTAICEHCGWTKQYDTKAEMERGLATHQGQWCKGPQAETNHNGHKHEPARA